MAYSGGRRTNDLPPLVVGQDLIDPFEPPEEERDAVETLGQRQSRSRLEVESTSLPSAFLDPWTLIPACIPPV